MMGCIMERGLLAPGQATGVFSGSLAISMRDGDGLRESGRRNGSFSLVAVLGVMIAAAGRNDEIRHGPRHLDSKASRHGPK